MKRYSVVYVLSPEHWAVWDHKRGQAEKAFRRHRDAKRHAKYLNERAELDPPCMGGCW